MKVGGKALDCALPRPHFLLIIYLMKLCFLTGAGVSVESGLSTFRGEDGLWEGHDVREVASIEAWQINQELVLEFYNQRRRQLGTVMPNRAHKLIASLEDRHDVTVVTQNVDDLHERGGSSNVIHLHGQLTQAKSSINDSHVIDIGYEDIEFGQSCPDGHQLRPNIVWFGEMVPLLGVACDIVEESDLLVVLGTSLEVHPAANLIHYCKKGVLIDPEPPQISVKNFRVISDVASLGMEKLVAELG